MARLLLRCCERYVERALRRWHMSGDTREMMMRERVDVMRRVSLR